MKVNLPHLIKQIHSQPHRVVLEQFEQHLRETIRGEHTLAELAETYCLDEPKRERIAYSSAAGD